jgi:hypothetical protein
MGYRTIGQPMRYQFFFIAFSVIFSQIAFSQNKVDLSESYQKPILEELKPFYAPSEGQSEDLLNGEVISVGKVDSPKDKEQQMMLFVAGIHPRNCVRAMRKLSSYENYSKFIDFIKKSNYDDQKQSVNFVMDHTLLPFPMDLTFKIPRITKAGNYPFIFETGFLKNLKGTIAVKDVGKFCLMSLKADWRGPETKIPNFPFSMFIQTVGKVGLEHLIRISLF